MIPIRRGAVQFCKDVDLAVLADSENLDELGATRIAVPPFEARCLDMGLAVHFRTHHPEAETWRIDILSKMRNVESVDVLWSGRTLPDLILAKKTQRDKDWPVIARLVENHFRHHVHSAGTDHVAFSCRELRSVSLLVELATVQREKCAELAGQKPLARDDRRLRKALLDEQFEEQEKDRQYWQPLRQDLERLRHEQRQRNSP